MKNNNLIRGLALGVIALCSAHAYSAVVPADSDGDGLYDTIELWLLEQNPSLLDDDNNPVSATVTNTYLDDDGDAIPNIIEQYITLTDPSVDDQTVCAGGGTGGVDLTGMWDVRISPDLTQATNFLTDKLKGVSICHTASILSVFDPQFGYADTATFTNGPDTLEAAWLTPSGTISVSLTYSASGGIHLGPYLVGTVDYLGTTIPLRADLRHILDGTESQALSGVMGQQLKLTDAVGNALPYSFNPLSDGTEIFVEANGVSVIAYSSNGEPAGGFYVPSQGSAFFANHFIVVADFDNDGLFDDELQRNDVIIGALVEPPVAQVAGMIRGTMRYDSTIDIDYLTFPGIDITEEKYMEFYAKYQLPGATAVSWNTPSGPIATIALLNVPTSAEIVNLTGPVGSGYETGVDVIGGTSGASMADVVVANRIPGFVDGERVGLAGNGNSLNITLTSSSAPNNINGAYVFNLTATAGPNPGPVAFNYTQPTVLLPLVDEASITLDGDLFVAGSANRRNINPNSPHTLSWAHVDNGSISAALYEIRLEDQTAIDFPQLRMFVSAGDVCVSGLCTIVVPLQTFSSNHQYRITIRPWEGTSGAAARNRSKSKNYFVFASGTDCTSDSTPANVIASAPCGVYKKITTRQQAAGPDVTIDYMVHTPSSAPVKALAVLLAGGNGDAQITGDVLSGTVASAGGNFLVRSAQLIADQGFLTLTLDRPSDTDGFGSIAFDGYRISMKHAVDIANVINAENSANLDVFIVGTSRGAISAVSNYSLGTAIAIPSAVTSDPGTKIYVGHPAVPPENVTVPVHYLVHQNDGCAVSNPLDAPAVFARFTSLDPLYSTAGVFNEMPAPLLGGFVLNPNPCKATTYHGFLGRENSATSSIGNWMSNVVLGLQSTYVGNGKPVAQGISKVAYTDIQSKVVLSAYVSDADSDPLEFSLPHATSSRGGGLAIEGGIVTYTPSGELPPYIDTFAYVVKDGKGGVSTQVVLLEVSGPAPVLDTDDDTVLDVVDNCVLVSNVDQRDIDLDGYGSLCDPDFNNDEIVNAADLGYMKVRFFTNDPLADLNGDGFVNAIDLGIIKNLFFSAPGPSGILP